MATEYRSKSMDFDLNISDYELILRIQDGEHTFVLETSVTNQ